MKLAWLTDIHLDCNADDHWSFCDRINAASPGLVVVTGDISQAPYLGTHLGKLRERIRDTKICFVLGNHDFHHGSIYRMRDLISREFEYPEMTYLSSVGAVPLGEEVALVGHDGWYDGGYADWFASQLMMPDYVEIREFRMQVPNVIHGIMNRLANDGARHIESVGGAALVAGIKTLIVATHVPPFRENSRSPDGSPSNPHWLPVMASKKSGDALLRLARKFPDRRILCLSGHTHTACRFQATPNLLSLTGQAEYGAPGVSFRMIDTDTIWEDLSWKP